MSINTNYIGSVE
jgi:hypothetical protein